MNAIPVFSVRAPQHLQGRIHQRLWMALAGAAVFGSGLMAVVAGVLALSTTQQQVHAQIERDEADISVYLTSYRPLYQLQRALQNATTDEGLDQALVVDQRGVVLAAADQALVGLPLPQILALPDQAVLRWLYSDCPSPSVLHGCLLQERQRFLGWLPWLGGDVALAAHPYPLALEGAGRFGDRATLITVTDLSRERQAALSFVLAVFALGLLPLLAGCLGLVLIVRRALLPELLNLAQVDPLSGVYNRRAFLEAASLKLRRAAELKEPMALALIDIDFFKKINDTYGHDGGDRVIQAVTVLMQKAVRSTDVVGRLGGDEFVLLMQLPGDLAAQACGRLLDAVAGAQIEMGDASTPDIIVGLSVGVASSEGPGGYALEDLMEAADAALYVAKDRGRRQVVYLEGEMRDLAVGGGARLRPIDGWQIRGL